MIIKNVLIYNEDKYFEEGDIYIKDGLFVEPFEEDDEIIDGQGCYVIPGLIDIHFHGCMGYDFCDGTEEALKNIAKYQASQGITTIVPATMALPEEYLMKIMANAGQYKNEEGATLAGINMEGPYISKAKKGAMLEKFIRKANVEEFRRLQQAANGLIKLCDIAPEEEGAMEFIDEMKNEVRLSLAHTSAGYDIAKEAYERGACHLTHLFNAMPPFAHRDPGVIGAARDNERVMCELICDGIHVHPAAVRGAFEMFGDDRIVFVSDSLKTMGIPDGVYQAGDYTVKVEGKRVTLPDGTIAGSNTNLLECMRTAVLEMDIPLESAVGCATINPARSVGIDDKYGSITVGKVANAVLLNYDLTLKNVILKGNLTKRGV